MKKIVIIIISVALIAGSVTYALIWSQAPSRGKVVPVSALNNAAKTDSVKKLDGAYISLQHRAEYEVQKGTASNNDLERYTLSASTQYNKQILASVVNLPGGQLKSNGDYIYRHKSPETYTSRKLQVKDKVIDVWVKKDGTEQTAMIPRGDKAAVVSLVAAAGANLQLTTEMNELLHSLEWQK